MKRQADGEVLRVVIMETEAYSQENNHTRLSLLSPYSFSDLDALMRFLNLRLK